MAKQLRRRVRKTSGTSKTDTEVARILEELKERADSIDALQHQIEVLQEDLKKAKESMQNTMMSIGVAEVRGLHSLAEVVTPQGRASTVIDPEAYYQKVELSEFFDSVKVLKTQATSYLSGKELQSISKTTPGKPKDPVLKVTHLKG